VDLADWWLGLIAAFVTPLARGRNLDERPQVKAELSIPIQTMYFRSETCRGDPEENVDHAEPVG
jgi:hypothetical protein